MNTQDINELERAIVLSTFLAGIQEIVPEATNPRITLGGTKATIKIRDNSIRFGHEKIANFKEKISQIAMALISKQIIRKVKFAALLPVILNVDYTHFYNVVCQFGNTNGPISEHFYARMIHNAIRKMNEKKNNGDDGDLSELISDILKARTFDVGKFYGTPHYANYLRGVFSYYWELALIMQQSSDNPVDVERIKNKIAELNDTQDKIQSNTLTVPTKVIFHPTDSGEQNDSDGVLLAMLFRKQSIDEVHAMVNFSNSDPGVQEEKLLSGFEQLRL
jgi:hypothetical protein